MSSLQSKAAKGILWSAIEQFSAQGIQFLIGLVIARLVMPEQYGLIAMLGIFLAVANVFVESGFSTALIQRQSQKSADYSTVFYFNIVVASLCYGVLWFSAPFIAEFYEQPELEIITKVISLSLIINSFGSIQRTRFAIAINFRTPAIISLSTVIVAGVVGIIMAYKGYGVWALVFLNLTNSVLSNILLWLLSKWRPKLEYSWQSFRELFGFGSKILMTGLLHTIYINLYTLFIGKWYNPADVGYYNRASTISQYPSTNIMALISKVMYPLQCSIKDDDQKLLDSFVTYTRLSCFIVIPLSSVLAAIAYPLVGLLLTEKWLPIAPLLQILCLAYTLYPIATVNFNILNVKGRSDYFLKAEVIKKILAILILLITLPFGLIWLCAGVVMCYFLDVTIGTFYARKVLALGYLKQLEVVLPIYALSIFTGFSIFSMTILFDSYFAQILVGLLVGAVVFMTLVKVFKFNELKILISLIKKSWK